MAAVGSYAAAATKNKPSQSPQKQKSQQKSQQKQPQKQAQQAQNGTRHTGSFAQGIPEFLLALRGEVVRILVNYLYEFIFISFWFDFILFHFYFIFISFNLF